MRVFILMGLLFLSVGISIAAHVSAHRAAASTHRGNWPKRLTPAEGRTQAEIDIANGVLKLQVYGLMSSPYSGYNKLVREKLGVEIVSLGCIVENPLYTQTYNNVMLEEIENRFGPNALEDIRKEAEAEYEVSLNKLEDTEDHHESGS